MYAQLSCNEQGHIQPKVITTLSIKTFLPSIQSKSPAFSLKSSLLQAEELHISACPHNKGVPALASLLQPPPSLLHQVHQRGVE